METFIAGFDAEQYDLSDWDVNPIPVYLNTTGLPSTITAEEVETMLKQACFSWSLRYSHDLVYMGRIEQPTRYESIVLTYSNSAFLATIVQAQVNGLCRYHVKNYDANGKAILWGAELHINYDNRPIANDFALGTITHEVGHACGIHGHLNDPECVMNTYGMGVYKLTLKDVHMLDDWNYFTVELNKDSSLTCPAVKMPDGHNKWLELKYTGNSIVHSWSLDKEIIWEAPLTENVTIGGPINWNGYTGQEVNIASVKGQGMSMAFEMVYLPNGNLVLVFAQ